MSSFDEKVGALLRIHRKAADKKLKEAGALIGISEGQMSRREKGEASTDMEEVIRLAAFYGCEVSDLIPRGKPKKVKP